MRVRRMAMWRVSMGRVRVGRVCMGRVAVRLRLRLRLRLWLRLWLWLCFECQCTRPCAVGLLAARMRCRERDGRSSWRDGRRYCIGRPLCVAGSGRTASENTPGDVHDILSRNAAYDWCQVLIHVVRPTACLARKANACCARLSDGSSHDGTACSHGAGAAEP